MKKIIIISLLLFITGVVSAQSYQEYMNQAKEAEQNNKLATALGMYYDAAHTSDAELEAENRFTEIKTVLESGKPDLAQDEDIFTKNEKWIDLRKDFISYFTNNCPWTFYFSSDFERVKLNPENKTADYKVYYTSRISKKYRLIEDIINKGSPEEAKKKIPINGSGTEINIKELTNAKTWSKEWYDILDEKIEKLNTESPYKYYLGQEYQYGSKEQQYFYSVVNKTDFSTKDPTFEDFLKIVNDNEAYQWVNLSVPPMASIGMFVTLGLYEGNTLLYEIPNVMVKGCSFNRTTENEEFITEDRKQDCKSISILNIPHDIVNKIENKAVRYEVIKSFIPYGFYAFTNNSEIISMKMGKTGDLRWEGISGTYSDVSAKNLDKTYQDFETLKNYKKEIKNKNISGNQLSSADRYKFDSFLSVYKTNSFGEITELLLSNNMKQFDKKDAKKIVTEFNSQGWEVLKDYNEDFFNQLPMDSDLWPEERLKKYKKTFNESYWTEEELNNKKAKGERNIIFKKKYTE